ncbi:hypothetical protein G7Z17_g11089 [Cylindrodendrum hubeiense]|uniref:Uncharacterized protein n=1 Tax=Cylindrodendrum hubeiense TaxID=595255 RepID=A0A9P5GWI6_9HYPO|nr:hypothetical protein G7Z17_g11089 [Cylindrodendrum hubeiense]
MLLLAFLLAPLAGAISIIPSLDIPATDIITGKYIVTLSPDISTSEFNKQIQYVKGLLSTLGVKGGEDQGLEKIWSNSFQGYSGRFGPEILQILGTNSQIVAIEPVLTYRLEQTNVVTQLGSTWGLSSISHRTTGSTNYTYKQPVSSDLWAYVLDTGVYTAHSDFEGRAVFGYNAVSNSVDTDTNGHGTHCAGTIASKTYGVAKKANIMAVKVFSGESSTTDVIIDGLEWAVANITGAGRAAKSVISLSIGGVKSNAFNTAVNSAYTSGVLVVVAAGNNGFDAGFFSPGSATYALTVGAIDKNNARPSFSNYGKTVAIFAPGVNITSLGITGPSSTIAMSGTSMACPHVAGLALYLIDSEGIKTPADVTTRIKTLGTKGVVTSAGLGSPNLVTYNGVV